MRGENIVGRGRMLKVATNERGCPVQALLGREFFHHKLWGAPITDRNRREEFIFPMPWGLKRFHQSQNLHFLTFSCDHRLPNFQSPHSRVAFESSLEKVRTKYALCIY